jgi:hypothetical protein
MKRDKNSKAALLRRLAAWDRHDRVMRREINRLREEVADLERIRRGLDSTVATQEYMLKQIRREMNKRTRVLIDLVAHNIEKPL